MVLGGSVDGVCYHHPYLLFMFDLYYVYDIIMCYVSIFYCLLRVFQFFNVICCLTVIMLFNSYYVV